MKFSEIEIVGFKRTNLHNTHKILYRPYEKLQIIIGPNGSGKSSLLEELTPFPTNRNDYEENGYKILKIEHNRKLYELKSIFTKTPKYHFIVDGEELNQSGNKSTQAILAEDHFGFDTKTMTLMIGIDKFTTMSLADRKMWFTKASGKDHTYGLAVYKAISERLRATQSVLKHLRHKKVLEEDKILSDDELKTLEKYDCYFNAAIEDLRKIRPNRNTIDNIKLQEEYGKQAEQISSKIRRVMKDPSLRKSVSEEDIEKLQELVAKINGELKIIRESIDRKTKQLKLKKELKLNTLQELEDHKESIKKKIEKVKSLIDPWFHSREIDDALQEYWESISYKLRDLLESYLETNNYGTITNSDLQNQKERIQHLEDIIRTTELREAGLINLQEMKDALKVHMECPNCKHRWISDIGQLNIENTSKKTSVEDLRKELEIEKKKYEDIYNRYHLAQQIKSIINNSMVWKYITIEELLTDTNSALNKWITLNNSIGDIISYKKLRQQLEEIENNSVSEETNETVELLEKELEELIQKETKLTHERIELLTRIKADKEVLEKKNTVKGLMEEGEKVIKKYNSLHKQMSEKSRQIAIDKLITEFKEKEQKVRYKLQENERIKRTLTDTIKEIEKLSLEEVRLKTLLKTISPTEGIIGESIMNGIIYILEDMNNLLSKIWRYDIEVLPCSKGDDIDLSYRFPVRLENHVSSDVSKVSSSMQEIINLVFKIVILSRLGITDYPLYLDEFGRSFDGPHRDKAYEMVYKELTTSEEFSQVFLISHYIEDFGYFKNRDVVSLSRDTNLFNIVNNDDVMLLG